MIRPLALLLLVACQQASDDSSNAAPTDAQPATLQLTDSDSSCSGVESWWALYDFGTAPKGVSMLYCARNGTDDDGEALWLCEPFTGWRLYGSELQWNCQVSVWNAADQTYLMLSYW